MSYKSQYILSNDAYLFNRISACAALKGIPDPASWAGNKRWEFSAYPGCDEACSAAIAAEPDKVPGDNEEIITDLMILNAVTTLRESDKPVE